MIAEYKFDPKKLPKHVAIIMDGNGRWAKKHLWNRIKGHREGAKSVEVITEFARKIGIEYLTLYAFSTENWNRPDNEVKALMKLLKEFLEKKRETLIRNNIRLNCIGQIHRLPDEVRKLAENIMKETGARSYKMTLTLALSYGSREEIISAVRNIADMVKHKKVQPSDITEEMFSEMLYTGDMPDPDLIIRTSGEERISNFLLWQIAYAEFYFTNVLWPDFREKHFAEAVKEFMSRERRYGKTGEQVK